MAKRAVRPSVPRTPYQRAATPQKTPERPDPTPKQRYLVVGHRTVFGTEPGEVVELEITKGESAALCKAGHLQLVDDLVEDPPKDSRPKPPRTPSTKDGRQKPASDGRSE